jgi:RimJ/RimL family protein N-acetyltransferase
LSRLIGVVDPRNVASIRVAEKIGMHAETTTVIEGDPYVIYAMEPGKPRRLESLLRYAK